MKNKRLLLAGAFSLALIVGLTPLLSACGTSGNQVAKADQPLKIGMMNPLTGVAAEKGRPMADGNLDAIKYINEELGGIDGHP